MTVHLIPLEQIDPNPYQPREREDPEHVERVARSIESEGLLQEPLARAVHLNGADVTTYQLAFGHTRVAAYRWLDAQGGMGFDRVPMKLADLTDLQMFELAVRENSERKDLTPIEEARAMAVYRDLFEKSSEEIGALFGLAPSTVRNKMRLLQLPEAVQAYVEDGALSEGTARSLLTVQKIVPEKETIAITESLTSGEYTNPESVAGAIKGKLRGRDNVLEMWSGISDGEPKAGEGLWGFDWKPEGLLKLTQAQFRKIFPDIQAKNEEWQDRHERWGLEQKKADLVSAFLWDVASLVFAPAFVGLSKAVLPDLAECVWHTDDEDAEGDGRWDYYRRCVAMGVIDEMFGYMDKKLGAAHAAGHLQGVAITWGVQLPEDWEAIAARYEIETVSTETD